MARFIPRCADPGGPPFRVAVPFLTANGTTMVFAAAIVPKSVKTVKFAKSAAAKNTVRL